MAARKAPLRTVKPGEQPPATPKAKVKSLAEAIEGGDYLDILLAQRREMVRDVREEKGPAKAAMHRQIALLSKEIAALQAAAEQEAAEDGESDDADEPFTAEAL